jgi:hypothetical protein
MRHVLIIAAGVLALGNVAAIAQPARGHTPIPDASRSEVSNHANGYGGQGPAEYFLQHPNELLRDRPGPYTDGSRRRLPPVSGASGSEVTNPDTYR